MQLQEGHTSSTFGEIILAAVLLNGPGFVLLLSILVMVVAVLLVIAATVLECYLEHRNDPVIKAARERRRRFRS